MAQNYKSLTLSQSLSKTLNKQPGTLNLNLIASQQNIQLVANALNDSLAPLLYMQKHRDTYIEIYNIICICKYMYTW